MGCFGLAALLSLPSAGYTGESAIAMATKPVTQPMMGQMQAYSPFNGKKYETLSYLPPLSDGQIKSQIDFMIKNRWTPCLEVSGDGDIYLKQPWVQDTMTTGIGRCTSCQCSAALIRTR